MKARDVMTSRVVSVSPDTPIRQVARILLENGISAVPVVDADGAPLGMISEGDLVDSAHWEHQVRRDWWLTLLAEGEMLSPEFLAYVKHADTPARDRMHAPVIGVTEDTETVEIARLLMAHHIKRVPVLRGGRVVGIVSRADLVRALAAG
jgi:CBS domain-containing protein